MNKRFKVPGVDARTPLSAAAPAILLTKAEPLFELEEAARGGADIDAVHDMRVASRRLREALRLLGPLYPKRDARIWYRRIRNITRALGPVRDSDVFIEAFADFGTQLGEGGRRAVAFLVGFRSGQRVHELDLLNHELGKLDLEQNKASFARFTRSLGGSVSGDRPLADFAHAEVASRAAVVFGAQPTALDEANMLEQHALRIDYKRLRYAVEAFAPCYDDAFDGLHATLTSFQDALGDLHDAHIFLEMLSDPERIASASQAGVSQADVSEVAALLESRAHAEFERFSALAVDNPADRLLPALLLPLAAAQEPRPAARGSADRLAFEPAVPQEGSNVEQASRGDRQDEGDAEASQEPDASTSLLPTTAEPGDTAVPAGEKSSVIAPVIVGAKPWEDDWELSEDEQPVKPTGAEELGQDCS